MYFVWNLQDCFFKALAAKYWAFVPCQLEQVCTGYTVKLDVIQSLHKKQTNDSVPQGSRK